MTLLPQMQTVPQLSTKWASILNPLLQNPVLNCSMLSNISLVVGANSIDHKLGRPLQGWYVVRMRSNFSQIYDTQDKNTIPDLTLNINSSAAVVVDLVVF